ncbi:MULTISPECIES: SPOCS domain-containing protein [Caproicibacterium]|jgi:hypothetical protein|uniref:DUF3794 domain-containing protein n=1 Tax=Caproicibacterium lactatifermentans TaxID=2666138 RepID=A0A859DQV0_9FIRM|nr:SPOCS domain-containing protein [Caproicibacterium lactatifermentans]MDD4807302.1 DUF3794 domain-containing protein [Oscillospiraceae bacterium]QKN23994.1 DUF3794 domain-containing protein [Caproicibacterium lactatifermentans]
MLNREVLSASEVIYDGCQEQPIDLDISLPDYCPDIQRILKCQVCPSITSRSVSGDRLEVEGTCAVRVYYLDAGGKAVRCYETESPYLTAITLKQPSERPRILTSTRVEYINCRPTSPRRLDIHGAFSVCARVCGSSDMEIVTSADDKDMEQQTKELSCSMFSSFSQQPFTVEDTLELTPGKTPAETILRTDTCAVLKSAEPMEGQVMAAGEVHLHILYASGNENAEPEFMEYVMPFTQLLDCDGISAQTTCRIQLTVSGVEIQVQEDYSGESSAFDTHVHLLASVTCFTPKTVTALVDAYSRTYELNITRKQKTLESLNSIVSDTCSHRFTVQCDDGLTKVLDLWSEPCTVTAAVENGELKFVGKLPICVLALNKDNTPFYFERSTEFTCTKPIETQTDTRCAAEGSVLSLNYHLAGGEMDLKAEILLTAEVYGLQTFKFITEIEEDTAHTKQQDTAALCIYFADAGEKLWDIARHYCTSVQAIQEENGLAGETVENQGMLLIPM